MTDTKTTASLSDDLICHAKYAHPHTTLLMDLAADRLLYLEDACRVKDAKFDRLCKDFDARNEYVEELKRIIATHRATLEEIAKTSSS